MSNEQSGMEDCHAFHAIDYQLLLLDYPLVTNAMTGSLESLPYCFVVLPIHMNYVQLRPISKLPIKFYKLYVIISLMHTRTRRMCLVWHEQLMGLGTLHFLARRTLAHNNLNGTVDLVQEFAREGTFLETCR